MILIITPDTYQEHSWELSEMFRLRHRVFKERLGWNVTSENGEERDQFDELQPTYILAFDDSKLVGCMRMLPTTSSYMLGSIFPKLLNDRTPPNDPGIWECSRFAVDCQDENRMGLAAKAMASAELFCGMAEYCLSQGIHSVLSVYDARVARLYKRFGIFPEWKTGPCQINETSAMAGLFSITQQNLRKTRAIAGIEDSVLSRSHHAPASVFQDGLS